MRSIVQIINDWIEEKTNHKIKDMVSSNSLNRQTRLMLVNALHFKGTWKTPFIKQRTSKATFYSSSGNEARVRKSVEYLALASNDMQPLDGRSMPRRG